LFTICLCFSRNPTALLDLVLINKKGLVEYMKVGAASWSDHEMVEFRILCGGSKAISRIKTLDFRRVKFGLFRDLLRGILWVKALEGRGSPRQLVAV